MLEIDLNLLDDLTDHFYEVYLEKKNSGKDFDKERILYRALHELFLGNIHGDN